MGGGDGDGVGGGSGGVTVGVGVSFLEDGTHSSLLDPDVSGKRPNWCFTSTRTTRSGRVENRRSHTRCACGLMIG